MSFTGIKARCAILWSSVSVDSERRAAVKYLMRKARAKLQYNMKTEFVIYNS